MESVRLSNIKKNDSLEEFEFFDGEEDLDVDLSKSPPEEASENITSGISKIIYALCSIAEEQGLTVDIPVKAVAATAVGAITGSLLGGPSGLAVGLLTGAVIAYRNSPSRSPKEEGTKFSIRQIFSKLTFEEKKELVKEMLRCLKQPNTRCLIFEILKNKKIRNMALEILSNFLLRKMGISLIRSQ